MLIIVRVVVVQACVSKWERDPLQYACRAYCSARQEVNILLALRHANIVPFVGVCPRPLALVLELAPQGALDHCLKHYQRSGARLTLHTLQAVILQVGDARLTLHTLQAVFILQVGGASLTLHTLQAVILLVGGAKHTLQAVILQVGGASLTLHTLQAVILQVGGARLTLHNLQAVILQVGRARSTLQAVVLQVGRERHNLQACYSPGRQGETYSAGGCSECWHCETYSADGCSPGRQGETYSTLQSIVFQVGRERLTLQEVLQVGGAILTLQAVVL